MKSKVLKILVVMLLVITLTATNFILVGSSLISYAQDSIATNHQNVEFQAYFKDKEGKKVATLGESVTEEEIFLYLQIGVKREGYLNGQITINNSNFKLVDSDSSYINKIEGNTIYLNQINVGMAEEIKVKIKPMLKEEYTVGLLNMPTTIELTGTYKDKTEKDISIKASRELTFELVENIQKQDVLSNMEIITNKIVKVDGEEKRILQVSYNMGLKENQYPMKEIKAEVDIPKINNQEEEKAVNVTCNAYLNNMTDFNWDYSNGKLQLTLKNEAKNGTIKWKQQGSENVIITCLYEPDVKMQNVSFKTQEKVTLHNSKEIENNNSVSVEEEKDSILQIQANNSEEAMYKGKLYAGIDREYEVETQLKVNYAKAIENVVIQEDGSKYIANDLQEEANVSYVQTAISKEQFNELFGEKGEIVFYNQNKEKVGSIDAKAEADEDGYITVSYPENVQAIQAIATAPVTEGILELKHTKVIKQSGEIVKTAQELTNKVVTSYNVNSDEEKYTKGTLQETQTTIGLQDTVTSAKLEVNKQTLSTVVSNQIEIKAILVSNNEKYDLYKNPHLSIQMPEQVENVDINSIELLYENELKIANYELDGRTLHIYLEGQQTQYKNAVIDGATIVINATLQVNRKSATKDEQIVMNYQNEGAVLYENEGNTSSSIKIVAPRDLTAIQSIKELGVETLGDEQEKQILVPRGTESKALQTDIEVINNQEQAIENVRILGEFPTNNDENNMGIQVANTINVEQVPNAKVYYTQNSNATDDLNNSENQWTEEMQDNSKVSKYLITVDSIEPQSNLVGSYSFNLPADLEYNQEAKASYQVKYDNSITKVADEMKATDIEMQTGIGPKVDTKVTATVAGKEENGTVKNGEVIRYKIEASNTGTEDVSNVKVIGAVPEGTTMVEPESHYEYTGASYYQELENKTYEVTIENLKVGETVYKEYEVRVNQNTAGNTKLENVAQVQYGDVTKQAKVTNEVQKGDIRVTVKRITDRKIDLHTTETVRYFAIVENMSATQKQDNVKVKTNLPENLQVETVKLITNLGKEEVNEDDLYSAEEDEQPVQGANQDYELQEAEPSDITTEVIDYKDEIDVGTIEPGKAKVLSYSMVINKAKDKKDEINFSVEAKKGTDIYRSNMVTDNINNIEVAMSMADNTQSEYVKANDVIEYTIKVENKSNTTLENVDIRDEVPEQLTVQSVTMDNEEQEILEGNSVVVPVNVEQGGTSTIKIQAVVDYSENREKAEPITNVAYAELLGDTIATTSEINHIIQAEQKQEEPEEPSQEEPNQEEPNQEEPNQEDPNGNSGESGNNQEPSGKNTAPEVNGNSKQNDIESDKAISGLAWLDENNNGQKDASEKLISNVKVKLLNTQTNQFVKDESGKTLEATTNENGVYVLDKVAKGAYIVVFEYDNPEYGLTKYKAQGVPEKQNSDAMMNELQIGEEKEQVIATDILELKDENISNINVGFVKLQNFDLKLDKYVSKILIQNANGSTVREYNDATMAKVELDAKQVGATTAIIEYKIVVTNQGEVEGYAKKIADYAPSDLTFSSELNKDWYQSGNAIYNSSLANEKIQPGESKIITLTLTKSMTENNVGLVPNTAEIAEDYNELGIKDSNSTPNNREKAENDYGLAEVILSIRTGGVVYVVATIIAMLVLGIVATIIIKKKNEGNK